MDRKAFFKQIGLKFGKVVEDKIEGVYSIVEENNSLNEQQKQFLKEYTSWLTRFQAFVVKRNKNPFDMENQKQLMNISAEAEKRRSALEIHMNDQFFSDTFNSITQKITEAISD